MEIASGRQAGPAASNRAPDHLLPALGPCEGAPRPDPGFGTRRQFGFVARYGLEGTRVMSSLLDADVIASSARIRRGELGRPVWQRHAFTDDNVSSPLDVAAIDFVNSLRGTQMRDERFTVASLDAEIAPSYFPDFESDLRSHLATFTEGPGAMGDPLTGCREDIEHAACDLLLTRELKVRNMQRRGQLTARVLLEHQPAGRPAGQERCGVKTAIPAQACLPSLAACW